MLVLLVCVVLPAVVLWLVVLQPLSPPGLMHLQLAVAEAGPLRVKHVLDLKLRPVVVLAVTVTATLRWLLLKSELFQLQRHFNNGGKMSAVGDLPTLESDMGRLLCREVLPHETLQ